MNKTQDILRQWAEDFESAASDVPRGIKSTILMTRAQEVRAFAAETFKETGPLCPYCFGIGQIVPPPDEPQITVECKCGWRGQQSTLVNDNETGEKHCPLCHEFFAAFPLQHS